MTDLEYAIVKEGNHSHLYWKHKDEVELWKPGPCLGGVPTNMKCDWRIGKTSFIQHRFRTGDSLIKYLKSKGWTYGQVFSLLDKLEVDE